MSFLKSFVTCRQRTVPVQYTPRGMVRTKAHVRPKREIQNFHITETYKFNGIEIEV